MKELFTQVKQPALSAGRWPGPWWSAGRARSPGDSRGRRSGVKITGGHARYLAGELRDNATGFISRRSPGPISRASSRSSWCTFLYLTIPVACRNRVSQGPSRPSSPGFPPYCQASSPRPGYRRRCKQGNLTPGKCPLTEQAVHEKPSPVPYHPAPEEPAYWQRFFDITDIRFPVLPQSRQRPSAYVLPGESTGPAMSFHTLSCRFRDLSLGIVTENHAGFFPECASEKITGERSG